MFGRRLRELKEDEVCGWCIHIASDPDNREYECRRFPPSVYKSESGSLLTSFPKVHQSDWCGEFQGKSRRTRDSDPRQHNEPVDEPY